MDSIGETPRECKSIDVDAHACDLVPGYQVMPPLSADEYDSLKVDIAERGVQVPVEYDELGNILDGHHRVQICGDLGISKAPKKSVPITANAHVKIPASRITIEP